MLCVGYLSCSAGCTHVFTLSLNHVSALHLPKWTTLGRISDLEYSTAILAFKQCIHYQRFTFPRSYFLARQQKVPDGMHNSALSYSMWGKDSRSRLIVPCAVAYATSDFTPSPKYTKLRKWAFCVSRLSRFDVMF